MEYKDHGKMHLCVPNYRGMVESLHYVSMYWLHHQLGYMRRDYNFANHMHTIIQTARQMSINTALADPDCTYVVFIDDDMTFSPSDFLNLEREFWENDLDYLGALGFCNSVPTKPCVFGKVKHIEEFAKLDTWWSVVSDYPRDQRFPCYATGFGMVMLSRRMLDGMRRDEDGNIIPKYQHFVHGDIHNEDIAFCINAQEKGFNVWCDSRVKLGHISKDRPIISEETWDSCGNAIEYNGEMVRLEFRDSEINCEKVRGNGNLHAELVDEIVVVQG